MKSADDRFEGKDAHGLLYCIQHAAGGIDAAAEFVRKELSANRMR